MPSQLIRIFSGFNKTLSKYYLKWLFFSLTILEESWHWNYQSTLLVQILQQNTKTMYKICSKLITTTPERREWCRCDIFIVSFEQISHIFLLFLLFTLNKSKQQERPNVCLQNKIASSHTSTSLLISVIFLRKYQWLMREMLFFLKIVPGYFKVAHKFCVLIPTKWIKFKLQLKFCTKWWITFCEIKNQ